MAQAPLSLYFDLEKGRAADLEVVARAAIAWSEAIQELAFMVDPSAQVRVELASGTAGSLSLDAIIRFVADRLPDRKTVATIVLTSLFWTLEQGAAWTIGQVLDAMKGADAAPVVAGLSDKDKQDIAERVAKQLESRTAALQVQRVYREAERDPAIKGVGTTTQPGKRPEVVVPRAAFAERAGHAQIREETITKRVVPQTVHVTLVRPVLVEDRTRRWRFSTSHGEFSANMKDQTFLRRLLNGSFGVLMVTGIQMVLDIETTEEFRGGVWVVTQTDVVRVVRLVPPPRQGVLPLAPTGEDEGSAPQDGDDESDNDAEPGV